jgi:hypothetical protein
MVKLRTVASAIADASISLTGIWREVLKFVRLALPLLRVSRGSLFDRNIRPSFRIVCVKLQPLLRARFGIRLDRLDRAFRLAHAAIDAFVRMDDEHVLTLVETIDGADLYAVHQFALDATLVDDVGQLIVLPADRGHQIIHDVRHRGARSLAESERREDLRPLAGSELRAMRILLLRGLRLLRCTKPLHRGTYSPGKHRSTDVPHSQLQWSALGAGLRASPFAHSRRVRRRRAPELRTDHAQVLFCPYLLVAGRRFARPSWIAGGPSTHLPQVP